VTANREVAFKAHRPGERGNVLSQISVQNVGKYWGATRAVDGVSFEAEAGSLVVLLGPSGCGKSTTLRLIAGLEQVSSGRIFIGGNDVTALPPAQRRIAFVFQSYALFPHLTVAENILFGLKVRKVPAAERARRLAHVAALLGLDALLQRKPSQLSGGQQQRVALGRAIIAETPVCLMDEPLSNLDAQLRAEMRREIRALQQKLGVTMVYVTHDQSEAMSMADQVILMRDGRVEQAAAPDALYARPATTFAARFIGTPPMNILTLAPAAGGAAVAGTEAPVLPNPLPGAANELLLGIRPEDVTLGDGIAARVQSVEFLGADTVITCLVGSQTLTARVPGKAALAPGAAIRVGWRAEAVHVFDAASGRRRDDMRPAAAAQQNNFAQAHPA
jgi:sn-glycerol 3-phosphate transport system ATP-binding protein